MVHSVIRRFASAAVIICGFAGCSRPESDPLPESSVSSPSDSAAWRILFDGRTTAGWRGYRQQSMPAGWTVENGSLVRSGEGGDIITADQFANFELALDWKVAPGGNSGIFYRVTE